MTRFIIDIHLDGYDTKEEHDEACEELIYDQLNSAGACIKIERVNND